MRAALLRELVLGLGLGMGPYPNPHPNPHPNPNPKTNPHPNPNQAVEAYLMQMLSPARSRYSVEWKKPAKPCSVAPASGQGLD